MLALNFFSSKGTLSKLRTTDKSSDDREVLSVYAIKDLEGDVFMYFVNLKSKNSPNSRGDGFVVVSGDKRFIPILAYGDDGGGLHPDSLNPGQKIWVDYIRTVYERVKYKDEKSAITELMWKGEQIFEMGERGKL